MIALLSFWLLFALSLFHPQQRQCLQNKPSEDWLLDGLGLCVQGAVIPLLQSLLLIVIYPILLPQAEAILNWHPVWGFLVGFVVVDYAYYWVHRGLHHRGWFAIHAVHHTVTQMDMVGTARNTLWSSLLIPYLWANSLLLYLLDNPSGYLTAIALTYLLDLWRHSCLSPQFSSPLYRALNPWLILPQDHATHHSRTSGGNFGANLKLWDKLHQTYLSPALPKPPLGIDLPLNLFQKLFFPFSVGKI